MSRRALLVGVQRSRAAQLRGPENDVEAMEAVLRTERFGFEVTALQDPNKTRSAIEAALKALVHETSEGDSLLFYYSGHGTHVTVPDRAETLCEALVPSDYGDGQDDVAIKEFELHDWLRPAVEKGAKVTAILDCCFSGGMAPLDVFRRLIQHGGERLRDALEAVPGEFVEDLGLIGIRAIARPHHQDDSVSYSRRTEPLTFARASAGEGGNGVVVFGACNAQQIAIEREHGNGYFGVFTHALVRVMSKLSEDASNLYVRDAVRGLLRDATPLQTPIIFPTESNGLFLG